MIEPVEPLHADSGVVARLERYSALLLERNAKVNLTSARDPVAVAVHIRDALTLLPYVSGALVDVGSGGGFPAIPLAIAAGVPVTLIESVAKKARFLRETLEALGLEGRVVCERAEVAGREPQFRGRYATATARAVGSLPTVLELTVPFLALGGRAVLQRGRAEPDERSVGDDAALVLGAALVEEVVLDGMHRVVLFEKRSATPDRFPRRGGIPAKRPLCASVDA